MHAASIIDVANNEELITIVGEDQEAIKARIERVMEAEYWQQCEDSVDMPSFDEWRKDAVHVVWLNAVKA